MVAYQRTVLSRHGYTEKKPCATAELCPAVALADLFGEGRQRGRAQTRALLERLPALLHAGRDLARPADGEHLVPHPAHVDRQAA